MRQERSKKMKPFRSDNRKKRKHMQVIMLTQKLSLKQMNNTKWQQWLMQSLTQLSLSVLSNERAWVPLCTCIQFGWQTFVSSPQSLDANVTQPHVGNAYHVLGSHLPYFVFPMRVLDLQQLGTLNHKQNAEVRYYHNGNSPYMCTDESFRPEPLCPDVWVLQLRSEMTTAM